MTGFSAIINARQKEALWAGHLFGRVAPSRVGRYRLTARPGAGGMGVVYLGAAKDGSQVAVKVPRPELADDPEFRTQFAREVATLVRVKGVCSVRVIEADTDSPRPFVVTEYADEPSRAEYVGTNGPLGGAVGIMPDAVGWASVLTERLAGGRTHGRTCGRRRSVFTAKGCLRSCA